MDHLRINLGTLKSNRKLPLSILFGIKNNYFDLVIYGSIRRNNEFIDDVIKHNNDCVVVDGEVKAMQVMLPHYFKELIGEDVTIREDGVYRDGEKIGSKEMLEVYGFRIPTSALNSIEAIEIAGFLPQEAGDAIMVPSEIVVKAGSDFDIDKLSIFLPNYTYNRSKNELNVIPFVSVFITFEPIRFEKISILPKSPLTNIFIVPDINMYSIPFIIFTV